MDEPGRIPAVIHVDVDGFADIARSRGWDDPWDDDPLFHTGVHNLLELFDQHGVRATFFVIASSLEDPNKTEVLREVVARGHEIASHSVTHAWLLTVDSERKRREIVESRSLIAEKLGVAVRGFRAPGYRLDRECVEYLEEAGYAWDSSAFPTPTFAEDLRVPVESIVLPGRPFDGLDLVEFPLPDHRPSPFPINPSYSLLIGHWYFRRGLARAVRQTRPFALLFHLVDASDPVPKDRLPGWRGSLYTLSMMDRGKKLKACSRILADVSERCEVTTTEALYQELGFGSDAA